MAKLDKDTVVKHHFWFLLIPFGLFALLAWIGLWTSVSDATDERQKAITTHQDELNATKAKSQKLVSLLEDQKKKLAGQRGVMWKAAWENQKDIYTWPVNYTSEQRAKLDKLKFGDDIPDRTIRQQFSDDEKYVTEHQALEDKIAPMQFNGGWRYVLSYIPKWGLVPSYEDIWLAMEDIWVQRGLVLAIDQVNRDAATFQIVKSDKDDPLHRKFQSRIWELDLKLELEKKGEQVLKATLKNRTERLQALGIGNTMILKVWLDKGANDPVDFPVEGEFVKGGETIQVKTIPPHTVDRSVRATELYKVEQVFDGRTVPVKRIDRVALSYSSSRMATLPLKTTTFSQKEIDEAQKAAAATGTSASGFGPPGMAMPPGAPSGLPSGVDPTMAGGVNTANSTDYTPNKLSRKRYIDLTPQVRRMPVGMVVIVDQAFIQDVLVALANSKLRFQTTQFDWNRFHGTLNYMGSSMSTPGVPTAPGGEGDEADPTARAPATARGSSDPTIVPRAPITAPRPPMAPPGGSGFFSGFGSRRPPGSFFPGPGGYGSFGTMVAQSSEDQLAASLVELSVYGIASLYQPYTPEQSGAGTPTTTPPLSPITPAPPMTPGANTPMPTTPMPTTPPKGPAETAPAPPALPPKQ
jgi:hypothetical protein